MAHQLTISDDFTLPLEAVTETCAVLGKRGKGKTATAVVLAEELIAAGQQVVVIDPTGVWWGLRSSADGKAGLPVLIVGGDHGDVPMDPTAGRDLEMLKDTRTEVPVPEIAEVTGYSAKSGGFRGALARLRQLELIGGSPGRLRLADELRGD